MKNRKRFIYREQTNKKDLVLKLIIVILAALMFAFVFIGGALGL